jgi:hypothetical protein
MSSVMSKSNVRCFHKSLEIQNEAREQKSWANIPLAQPVFPLLLAFKTSMEFSLADTV